MPPITLGGVLVAIVVLSAVAILIGRATRSQASVAHVLEEAARVNTARRRRMSCGKSTDSPSLTQFGLFCVRIDRELS
jgi:hypothetical protein